MIAPDHDRRFDLAAHHQLVHRDTKFGALTVTEPANACRQPLKMDPLCREFHPARERFAFRKQFESEFVCARNLFRLSTQRYPAKPDAAFAATPTKRFGNEAG